MAHEVPSTFLPKGGSTHPYYDKMEGLWDNISESGTFDAIASVVMNFVKDGVFDEEAYLEYVMGEYGGALDEIIDQFEQTPEVKPNMPPAPSPKQLYKRVTDVPVLDIGSGDCQKLSSCQSVSIVATDILPLPNNHYNVVKLDASKDLSEYTANRKCVLTSFNSLTQLDNIEQIAGHDGIHVFPDMDYVKSHMAINGDGTYGDYEDRDNGAKGDPICDGYACVSYFRKKAIQLAPVNKIKGGTKFTPQVEDIPYRPLGISPTPKYDGECMFLVSVEGVVHLLDRKGVGFNMKASGRPPDMLLMLEKLPLTGKPECFVLLRIIKYRDYYPFHGAHSLRNFCAQVKISLGGCNVYSPDDPALAGRPSDGLIFRFDQLDWRYKDKQTVDIEGHDVIKDLVEDGYDITIEIRPGLNEYEVENLGGSGRFLFKFIRPRHDKTRSTSADKIKRLLLWV